MGARPSASSEAPGLCYKHRTRASRYSRRVDAALLITNICLVLVTLVYVVLTGRMASASRDAADSARISASAAEKAAKFSEGAAEAAQFASVVAAAQAPVAFQVDTPVGPKSPTFSHDVLIGNFAVRNTGQAIVHIHDLKLDYLLVTKLLPVAGQSPYSSHEGEIRPVLASPEESPTPPGQKQVFVLIPPIQGDEDTTRVSGWVIVIYSFDGTDRNLREYPVRIEVGPAQLRDATAPSDPA